MPEIIGRNKKNEVECPNCGTKMRFRNDEVRAGERVEGSYDDHHGVVTCPDCGKPVKTGRYVSTEQAAREARDRDYDDI